MSIRLMPVPSSMKSLMSAPSRLQVGRVGSGARERVGAQGIRGALHDHDAGACRSAQRTEFVHVGDFAMVTSTIAISRCRPRPWTVTVYTLESPSGVCPLVLSESGALLNMSVLLMPAAFEHELVGVMSAPPRVQSAVIAKPVARSIPCRFPRHPCRSRLGSGYRRLTAHRVRPRRSHPPSH